MNQKTFESIAATLRQQAVAQARMMGLGMADADDVAQDAMLKLWAVHSDLCDIQHANRLARIATRHLVIDSSRHRKLTSELIVAIDGVPEGRSGEWQPPDTRTASPHRMMEMDEDERWLKKRIASLPDREMQVMTMRQVEQKSNGEIARILGITAASVATMLSSARRKIFEDFKKRDRR